MDEKIDRALLVMSFDKRTTDEFIVDYKNEFQELAKACNLEVENFMIQKRDKIEVTTFIGSGKVEEIKNFVNDNQVDIVVFNVELSGVQIRNLEDEISCKVIDRTMLILDIFARRAKSSISRMQVELAQQKYRLPRLIGLNENLSRAGSGIGGRGPGEQKLELDRRKINDRISELSKKLKDAEEKIEVTKKNRIKNNVKTCALVGYTNAGKSTLLNLFVDKYGIKADDAKVFAKDMLFATLDTYSRRLDILNKEVIMTDTVGFVSDLPHSLVKAFSSTLNEVKDADLILNIIDISDKNYLMQKKVTLDTLKDLGVDLEKVICVYNKADKLNEILDDEIYISGKEDFGIENLKDIILDKLFGSIINAKFLIPYDKSKYYDTLLNSSEILSESYEENGYLINANLTAEIYCDFKCFEV
ncbi:MAG: GTPase HflX [Clostridiales bacterium]|nr:MAG: GTPase HflX [Clostridiales bacterium]